MRDMKDMKDRVTSGDGMCFDGGLFPLYFKNTECFKSVVTEIIIFYIYCLIHWCVMLILEFAFALFIFTEEMFCPDLPHY